MKKFLKRVLIICVAPVILFMIFIVFYSQFGSNTRLSAFEVYEAIEVSGMETQYTTLILGDSVGRQFFGPDHQEESTECCYLATNQAITVAGNSILLQRFLENNPDLKKVYYVLKPESLKGGINFVYTYSYFVTPLFIETFEEYLFPETVQGVEDVFGKVCAEKWFPKWMMAKYPKILEMYNSTCNSLWRLRQKFDPKKEMPDVSLTYLAQMKQICDENGIELHLICVPLPEGNTFNLNSLEREMQDAGLETLYEEYVSYLHYVDADAFVDGIHLNREFLDENREQYISDILY